MKEMNLYPIMGLYKEIYNPDFNSMNEPLGDPEGIDVFKNINSYFWASILSNESIDMLIKILEDHRNCSGLNPKYAAVMNNPIYFKRRLKESIFNLSHHSMDEKDFFSYLETIQIFCKLYTEYVSNPFKLTIEDGFDVNETSSFDLINNALNPAVNPYYDFLYKNCKPKIDEIKPDIVWIHGRIRLSTITLAIWTKLANPEAHVSVVGHSSEYYSLNKIVEYLKMNKCLFSIIDSIVLDDTNNTMKQLYLCIEKKEKLNNVKNILFVDKKKDEIIQTETEVNNQKIIEWTSMRRKNNSLTNTNSIDASQLANIKLWPNSKCFWNKCTFCGINKKYDATYYGDSFSNIDEIIDHIKKLYIRGCRYYWFIDEAIPPRTITEIAKKILDNNLSIFWQVRSRIDYEFEKIDIDILYKSGLREIRLGLESANVRIQKLMNKFPEEVNNTSIEKLVSSFTENGISVHFPIIIGFPTESPEERTDTYDYLYYLHKKHPLLTFNINILGLDVSSTLFNEYWKFDISQIVFPCAPKYFLGNIVDWDCSETPFDYKTLDFERNNVMRDLLYPWMPTNCLLPVYVYYRLSETSRNTLIWKSNKKEQNALDNESIVIWSDANSYINEQDTVVVIYNLNTHHMIECDEMSISLIDLLMQKNKIHEIITSMLIKYSEKSYDWEYYHKQIENLYNLGFIETI